MLGINALRARHLENALIQYEKLNTGRLAVDTFLKFYFRANKVSTSNRSWVSEHMYEIMRWKALIEYTSSKPSTWTSMLNNYLLSDRWRLMSNNKKLPPFIRCSFPEELYVLIEEEYGQNKAIQICNILNEEPVIHLRVNTLKISRDKAYKFLLHKGVDVEKCVDSPCGLLVTDKQKLFSSPEYRRGIVEIQDESSQLVALRVMSKSGEKVLDYCAGSGGKSLVFGPSMENKGRIYLHDINENLLLKAKKRMYKAGIRNYFVMDPNLTDLGKLYGQMDWVVTDVPCTGVGAFRKSPERKWEFKKHHVVEYVNKQRSIVENALKYLKRNGKLVYITCSIFKCENSNQIDYFCKKHDLELVEPPTFQLPQSRGMNGYFIATLRMKGTI
ncbi:hypothetical protein BEWA_019180 [Theileria equi strain WA]|uniref:SAM-dependent MTase RsmB/NOP-type domain-containing protein n=1 Tax=Theileria equi strain WA TaxID=1537102 RepID=L0AV04_THEEQ|nr:hypothetical protein BEWA_019180 [Theileria equi strain WA]AFZ79073.1 hypothetical protein BEWA_019180 [Theileria equi strain WA]|eukprot:XP_004828739.1 hypothetical protein BEWA_019180 [Theileria equi strain WA]